MLRKTAYSGDPFTSPLSCRLYMVDGLGYCYPHLVVESPHDGAGINVADIPRRNDPTTVFTVAQQQGLMTFGLAGLGSPERHLFQCPIGNDVRVDGPSVNEVHCPVKTIGVFIEVELKLTLQPQNFRVLRKPLICKGSGW